MNYTELHCLTNFSFLEAASHPDELVKRAVALGYRGLAITDINTLAGIVRANTTTKDHPLQLIIGTKVRPMDAPPVVLWAKNRNGYGNLCTLITIGRRRAPKGQCHLRLEDLASHTEGLLAGVVPSLRDETFTVEEGRRYRDLFGDAAYLLAELHRGPHDAERVCWLKELSHQTQLPLVAAGNVLFHDPGRKPLHDVLTAIRNHTTVAQAGGLLEPNAERHLRPLDVLQELYADLPGTLERTQEIASQCTFRLDELRYEYPEELAPSGRTPMEYLEKLTWAGANDLYPQGVPPKVQTALEHELPLIASLHYEAFFLTVHDIVCFARSKGILCQGRGSAANSVVCYCLGITAVDPERINLLFERFISRERNEAPDIDVDFEHERREEVLQYLYDKYGRDRAGLAAVTITYRSRSAIRDVGKALGFSADLIDRLAVNADHYGSTDDLAKRCREAGLEIRSMIGRRFVHLVQELMGFPRHLSQHVGGMVITRGPLHELVPLENAAMENRTIVQWNKDDLDDLGILKVDCLALGMLTAIRKCFSMVEATWGKKLTLNNIPEEDPAVYGMIQKADTMGVFQIESRAQMSMLPRLKPEKFYDLVIEVAIVRPGPIQGDMVHPYLKRRFKEEAVTYVHPLVEAPLEKTLGVPLFQEQCMQLAIIAADFTPGEADQLRRAMGGWRRPGLIEQFRDKLLNGMQKNGIPLEFAEKVFKQICGFGEYGFPESHAASFALLVYISCWLKYYHLAEFTAALINSQPMGFYAPGQLIQNARRNNVNVLPPDVCHSHWGCTIESGSLRLGLRLIRGLSEATAKTIMAEQSVRPFSSYADFLKRTALLPTQIECLAEADALASLTPSRREAVWDALAVKSRPRQKTLFDDLDSDEPMALLPTMRSEEEVHCDYQTTGLSLRSHPIAFHREYLNTFNVVPAAQLTNIPTGSAVKVAGIVLVRQRPGTAKGITFVTLEDETGTANLILHKQTWERYRNLARRSQGWLAHGRLERRDTIIHIIINHLDDLSERLSSLNLKSRDFQ